jgi:hypothetical protein
MRALFLLLLPLLAALPARAQDRAPLHLTDREATRLAGLRVEIRDLRLGSRHFGRNVPPSLLADPAWFAARQAEALRIAPQEDTGLPEDSFEAWAARTGGFCQVTIGGPASAHAAPGAAALMAGVLDPAGAPDPTRLALRHLDLVALDRFTLDHEIAHCRDRTLRVATLAQLVLDGSGPRIAEQRQGFEVFADALAGLEFLRAAPHPDPAAALRELANLRQIAVVTNFRRGALGRDGRILLAPALAYHTAPALDAVLALARARGLAWLRARSPAELVALAEGIRDRHTLSRGDQAALARALADTRVDSGPGGARLILSPELPAAFVARFEAAAAEQGFRPALHEAPPAALPPAWRLAAAPQPLLDAVPGLRAALDPDLRDGARPLAVAALPGGARRVAVRVRDGRRSAVVVRPDGEVLRLRAGRMLSLALDRPALQRPAGALHVLPEGQVAPERAEAWFTGPLEPG